MLSDTNNELKVSVFVLDPIGSLGLVTSYLQHDKDERGGGISSLVPSNR